MHKNPENAAHNKLHNNSHDRLRIKEITSHANPEIKRIKSLLLKKNRDEHGLFLSEGLRHAIGAIEAGWTVDTLIFERSAKNHPKLQEILDKLAPTKANLIETSPAIMEKMTKRDNAQSVLAVIRKKERPITEIQWQENDLYVLLDNIRDPGNLGTIMRTVESCGAQGIILAGNCCDPYSLESIRASMGSFPFVPFYKISDAEAEEIIAQWRTKNVQIIGTHLMTDTDYADCAYQLPLLLVMGNEQAGMRDALTPLCTNLVKIPMHGTADSLNVAVATGIMLYQLIRVRA